MKRFFAFGCSYTSYKWLTWADILSLELSSQGYQCYNFGFPGMGNQGIAQTVYSANQKFKFTEDDIIAIMWSTWDREDRYINDMGWDSKGTIFNLDSQSNFSMLSNEYTEDIENSIMSTWSFESCLLRNMTAIYYVNSIINVTWQSSLNIFDAPISVENYFYKISTIDRKKEEYFSKLKKLMLLLINSVDNRIFVEYTEDRFNEPAIHKALFDGHPSIIQHLKYVENHIQPHLNINLSNETINQVYEHQNNIAEFVLNHCNNENFFSELSKLRDIFLKDKLQSLNGANDVFNRYSNIQEQIALFYNVMKSKFK